MSLCLSSIIPIPRPEVSDILRFCSGGLRPPKAIISALAERRYSELLRIADSCKVDAWHLRCLGMEGMLKVYIQQAERTKAYKKTELSLVDLLCEPAQKILSKVDPSQIEGVFVSVQNISSFTGEGNIATKVADRLGGLTMPSAIALISLEYARINNVSLPDFQALLEKIAIRAYRYAAANPDAQFAGKKITAEEYRDAVRNPPVATPLSLFDSCPTSDAAGAILVTNKESDIEISGVGHAVDGSRIFDRYYIDHLEATRWAARKAYKQAGILHPADLNGLIIEQHDAFGPLFLLNLVDLGIFTHAEALKAIEKGTLDKDGTIPTNISGGLKVLHALGGTGLIKIIEACRQLRGEAPTGLQVKKPKVAICHSIGGPGNNIAVTILDKVGNRRYRHHFRRWQPEPLPHNNEPHKPVLPQGILEVSTTVYPQVGSPEGAYTVGVVNCGGKR